jgi:hypothetical protein
MGKFAVRGIEMFFPSWRISPKRQNVFNPTSGQSIQKTPQPRFRSPHTGKMGQGFETILLLETGGYLQGIGLTGPPCPVGHGNEQGMCGLEISDHIEKSWPGNPFLGGKKFQRDKGFVILQQLTDFQNISLYIGAGSLFGSVPTIHDPANHDAIHLVASFEIDSFVLVRKFIRSFLRS